jgi:hypothetical protein
MKHNKATKHGGEKMIGPTCNLAPFCKKVRSVFMKLLLKEPLRRLAPPKLKSN